MPEGDVLHRAAAALQVLVGEEVEASSPHPRGLATGVAAAVDGRRLESVEAVGKNLVLSFAGGVTVRSHLRMSGRWRVQQRGAALRGRPWLVLRGRESEAVLWNGPVLELHRRALSRVGPDVLAADCDPAALAARLRRAGGNVALGEALLDQRLVSGIGTVWLAEALWQAEVSPWLRLAEVGDEDLAAVLAAARRSMQQAVAGGRRGPRAVYRRVGRPCRRCGAIVQARSVGDANRTVYWCPGCQRAGLPR